MALFEQSGARASRFSGLMGRIAQWNDDRFAVKALSRLTPRELDDIGLTPGDVERMARRTWF